MEITVNVPVTDKDLEDILVTAFEGGINYWAMELRHETEERPSSTYDYILEEGGTVELHCVEGGGWNELNREKLVEGIGQYISERGIRGRPGEPLVDRFDLDALVADLIVQYAVFGEVVYG